MPVDPSKLPLILAGPILRKTTDKEVSVFVVLKDERRVTLRVYSSEPGLTEQLTGTRRTVGLGKHLHVAVITAKTGSNLKPGILYFYNLFFGAATSPGDVEDKEEIGLNGPGILNAAGLREQELHYGSGIKLPSFSLCPDSLDHLRLIHGSCRKPHGESLDAMASINRLIEKDAAEPNKRPHQLFLTGDQIYADDVGFGLLKMIQAAIPPLIGGEPELLPGIDNLDPRLSPGQRSELVELARLTAGDHIPFFGDDVSTCHLLRFSEYCLMYVFAWSDRLWDKVISPAPTEDDDDKEEQLEIVERLEKFRQLLPDVAKLLANVPSYMICDDHDVTDDWYITLQWCSDVLRSPLGNRVIMNGSMSYALFQAWGNKPEDFLAGTAGDLFLKNISLWVEQGHSSDDQVLNSLAEAVAVPRGFSIDKVMKKRSLSEVHDAATLSWHFIIEGTNHRVLVLDTRTWRSFDGDALDPDEVTGEDPNIEDGTAAPTLLNGATRMAQIAPPDVDAPKITVVVSPVPVMTVSFVTRIQAIAGFFAPTIPDLEGWEEDEVARWDFLYKVVESTKGQNRVVFLSGDIHYGYASRMDLTRNSTPTMKAVLAQLNASAFHNEANGTRGQQKRGYRAFGDGSYREKSTDRRSPKGEYVMEHVLARLLVGPPSPKPTLPDLGDPFDKLRTTCEVAKVVARPPRAEDPITEIVGLNNFGEVTFNRPLDGGIEVVQRLHYEDSKTTVYTINLG